MQFRSVCIITQDVARLRDFYETILGVKAQGDDTFTGFPEGIPLTLYVERGMEELAPGCMQGAGKGRHILEFEVSDVDQAYERLKAMNVTIVKPPKTHPWGMRSVWFRDPDGNIVDFYARVSSPETAS